MITGRPPRPVRTASKTLREIFDIIEREQISHTFLAAQAGRSPSIMSQYRSGKALPDILTVEAMIQALGYRVALVPINKEVAQA